MIRANAHCRDTHTSILFSLSGVRDTFIVPLDFMSSSNSSIAASSCGKEDQKNISVENILAGEASRIYHQFKGITPFGIITTEPRIRDF